MYELRVGQYPNHHGHLHLRTPLRWFCSMSSMILDTLRKTVTP